MTQTFGGNANNDFYIDETGNLALLSGIDAVLDACATATKAQLGEMIYETSSGMPNFQTIWSGDVNIAQWELALLTTIQSVSGVDSVVSLDVSLQNNKLSYTVVIQTIYGQGLLSGII